MSVHLRIKRRFFALVMPRPTRVILLGTTTGTTWRRDLIEVLVAKGVRSDQIINPHLPKGQRYTPTHMAEERKVKRSPRTLIVMYVCPGVSEQPPRDGEIDKSQLIGPISMFEAGKLAYKAPHRTGVVLAHKLFARGKRLKGVADEICEDFGGEPPYFADLDSLACWVADRLFT